MSSPDLARNRIERARPVLREYATDLTRCRAVTVLPDEPVAVLGDRERLAAVDLDTGEIHTGWAGDDDSPVVSLAGLTGRRVLAVGFRTIDLYELAEHTITPIRHWEIDSDTSILDVAATASGSRFVVAAGDRFYVGDADRPDLVEFDSPDRTDIGTAGCLAAYVSPDGATVAVGRVGSIDVYTGTPLRRTRELRLNDKGIPVLATGLSPDGRYVVAGDDVTSTVMVDVESGGRTDVSRGGKVIATRWGPDGSVCALVVLTRSVGLVDPSGRLLAELEPVESGTYYFLGGGWIGDGDRFVVGTEHGKVLAWTLAPIAGHVATPRCLPNPVAGADAG